MSKKVLIVDDSAIVREQVRMVLTGVDFQVVEAIDGLDGQRVLEATDDVDLVICDARMPRMNGLALLEAIRSRPEHAAVPVVVLSMAGEPGVGERARRAGAEGWLVKPFRASRLIAEAQRLTR